MSFNWCDWGNDDFNWDMDVNYDFTSSVDSTFAIDASFESNLDVYADICADVNIDGNLATFYVDVQAVGDDGATEVNIAVVTTDDYSSIVISGYSAVA
jgi:hypothetical protein